MLVRIRSDACPTTMLLGQSHPGQHACQVRERRRHVDDTLTVHAQPARQWLIGRDQRAEKLFGALPDCAHMCAQLIGLIVGGAFR